MKYLIAALLLAAPALHSQQMPASNPEPAAQAQHIELLQAQVDKLEAQSALLTSRLQGITEFQQWVQIQRDLQQKTQQLNALKAPPAAKPDATPPAPAKAPTSPPKVEPK